ncbi:MAG TPA: hypothetical protein VI197_15075 [Polyangiaceae bacterium]
MSQPWSKPNLALSVVIAAFAAACATPPADSPSPAEEPASGDSESDDASTEPESTSAASPAGEDDPPADEAPAEAQPPAEPLSQLCNKMCDAVAPKCTAMQLKGCRSTCDNYDAHPAACDGVVRGALECARADKDFLFCANVVPDSCAKQFKAINTCAETGKPPESATASGMPAGWERYKGDDFSVVVPAGMKPAGQGKWSVKAPDGVVYEVALHPAPEGKLNNRTFLLAGNKIFGACAPKLKLHAIVEKPDHTSIQYKTTCPDGNQQLGRMHVVGSTMYVLTAYLGTKTSAETDAFVYSFETN